LDLERFSALQPSLRHPDPRRLARRVARKLGHLLAIGGVSQEFLGRVHGLVPPDASSLGALSLGALSLGAERTRPGGDPVRRSRAISKLLGMFGKSQPAQGELPPRHSVVQVGRSLREFEAFAGTLRIRVRRAHGARSEMFGFVTHALTVPCDRVPCALYVSARRFNHHRPRWFLRNFRHLRVR
jgi:hypothetical protein